MEAPGTLSQAVFLSVSLLNLNGGTLSPSGDINRVFPSLFRFLSICRGGGGGGEAATWTIARWWYLANGGLPASLLACLPCLPACLLARCLENGNVSLCSVAGLVAGRVIPTNQPRSGVDI